jgi:hypothetical protein
LDGGKTGGGDKENMAKFDSLDELISKKAAEYADQIKGAAAMPVGELIRSIRA